MSADRVLLATEKQMEELVSLLYRRRVGDCRDRGDDRAEQALDNKGGPQKSPKQSIDSNSYTIAKGM
jgi:hypothetical protein